MEFLKKFSIDKFLPNFWFIGLIILWQRWIVILAWVLACVVFSLIVAPHDTKIVGGIFASLVVVSAFVVIISYRQFLLMSHKLRPSSMSEVLVRKSPVLIREGVFGSIGWLALTNRAFYFLPIGMFSTSKMRRWHLDDMESYSPGDDFSLPGNDAAMWVKVKHPSGTMRWLLPNANRWNVTFTIQLPKQRQRKKRTTDTRRRQV